MRRANGLRIGLIPWMFLLATGVPAQVADPTRPPDVLQVPADGAAFAMPVETGVQTIILRPGGKAAAVINGQQVVVGGKLGDKRVVRITEREVVLKGAGGTETIKVTPAVEKAPRPAMIDARTRNMGTSNK